MPMRIVGTFMIMKVRANSRGPMGGGLRASHPVHAQEPIELIGEFPSRGSSHNSSRGIAGCWCPRILWSPYPLGPA